MRQGAITACLALVFALGILPQHGMAQEPARLIDSARESADLVSDILNGPEFHVQETVEVPDIDWENFFDWDLGNSWLVDWLSRIFGGDNEIDISFIEVILWALVGILILLLVFHYGSWLQEFGRPRRRGRQTTVTLPTFLQQAGPEVLPDDVPTAARELWQSGDPRQALALLYRASLRHLIERHALPIHAGSTEGECASLVSARTQDATARYFKSLSTSWQLLAYGHIAVANQQFETLAAEWRAAIIEQSLTGAGS